MKSDLYDLSDVKVGEANIPDSVDYVIVPSQSGYARMFVRQIGFHGQFMQSDRPVKIFQVDDITWVD